MTGEPLNDRPCFEEQGNFLSKDARIVKETGLVSDIPEFREHILTVEKERGRYSGEVDTSKADDWKHEAFREDLVKYLGGMSNAELLAYLSDLGIYNAPTVEQGTLLGGDDDE